MITILFFLLFNIFFHLILVQVTNYLFVFRMRTQVRADQTADSRLLD